MIVNELIEILKKADQNKPVFVIDEDTGMHCEPYIYSASTIIEDDEGIYIFWGTVSKWEIDDIFGNNDFSILHGKIRID